MEGKKKYIAIILFLLIGLGVFTFANPDEELGTNNGSNNGGQQQVETDDNDDNTQNVLEEVEEDNNDNTGSTNNGNNVATRNDAYAKALAAVQKLEQVLTEKQAETARDLVEKVTNSKQYADLIARVENAEDAMNATKLVKELEKMLEEAGARADIEAALTQRNDVVTPAVDKIKGDALKEVKEELTKRVEALAKLLDDATAPTIEPDVDGTTTKEDVSLVITDDNEFTATVTKDGNEYELKETFTEEGIYEVKVVDAAFNEDTITFTIDKTEPEFENVKSGQHFGKEGIKEIKVKDATDVKVTIKNMDTKEENVTLPLTKDATYYIVATDAAGNSKAIYVAIDTEAPDITGVTNGSFVNKAQNVYVTDKFLNYVKITGPNSKGEIKTYEFDRSDFEVLGPNGENFKLTWKANYQGIYTVYAKDKVGNEYSETFTIDKTPVKVNGLENAPFTYDGVGIVLTSEDNDIKTITLTKDGSVIEGYKLSDSIINAGEYTLTIVDRAGNVTEETFVINKAQTTITMTPEEGTKFRYDATAKLATAVVNKVGSTENLTVTYKDDKGYKHTEPVKPGKYTATAVYAGDENHEGSEASVKYQIIKAASSIAFTSEPESLVYDGTAKEFGATVTLVNGTKAATITYYDAEGNKLDGAPVNAGSYKVVASFKGDTLHDGVKKPLEKEFTIERADITITMTPEEGTKFRYDATAKLATATLNTLEGPVALEVTYKDDKGYKHEEPIKPGKYTATAVFEGNQNYNPVTEEIKYQIIKAASSIAFTSEPESLVYDGTAKEFGATVTLVNGTKAATMTYYDAEGNKLDGAPVNAGSYKVVASFKGDTLHDGVKKPLEKEFTIEKATPTIEITEPSLVYNGEKQEYGIKVFDVKGNEVIEPNMVVYYKDSENETLPEAPTNAGTYRLGIYVRPNENYTRADKWITFTIEKATPTIEITEPSLVYNGEKQEYGIKVFDVKGNEVIEPNMVVYYKNSENETLPEAPTNAGTYRLGIYVRPNENYTRVDKWITFTVAPKEVYVKFYNENQQIVDGQQFEYNGFKHNITAKLVDKNNNVIEELNVVTDPMYSKDAGSYTATAVYSENSNYKLMTETEISFEITKKQVAIRFTAAQEDDLNDNKYVYDGETKSYKAELIDGKGNVLTNLYVKYSSLGKLNHISRTNVDTYTATAVYIENENYELIGSNSMTFEITPREVFVKFNARQLDLDNDNKYEYDGKSKRYSAILVDANDNKITDLPVFIKDAMLAKNVGTYTAVAPVNVDENSKLSNSNELTFEITKANLTITLDAEPQFGQLGYVVTNSEGKEVDVKATVVYYKDGKVKNNMISKGIYTVTASIAESDNYNAASAVKVVVVR